MSRFPFRIRPRPFEPIPEPSWRSTIVWIILAVIVIYIGAAIGVAHP